MRTRAGLEAHYTKLAAEYGDLEFDIRIARARQRELETMMRDCRKAIEATPDNVAVVPMAPEET